ncbi:gamma-glutamyltransferase [Bordetella trematum]|uniref:gamma-glutamyltransferase n=1 Tax=Bordetella trematum TaxID=123899 RepID=UPI000D90403D|nr:gamma-glutamyltransferase [Bordetella trematum]SPU51673.1 gamma-glutamyltranspeptidase [Bordetella trematum]VDH08403.1 Acylase ACY 1 [Bordetella trematum]
MKRKGMVVCPQPEAAESGIEVLRAGGNAIDAAVACALAQTVVDPLMCGIAGFGTAAVYRPGSGQHEYVDFHAPAPAAARPDMWEHLLEGEARDGFGFSIRGRLNDLGPQSIGVPGTLMGLSRLHQRHGTMPWRELVQPAIAWAREGYFVRPAMHLFWSDEPMAGRAANRERLAYSASGRQMYCRADGSPKPIGAPLSNPDYADTLEQLAQEGHDSFYRGDIARRMIDDIQGAGGILSLDDLAHYDVRCTPPLLGSYKNRRITTNQPPGGGAMLLEMLNILEAFELQGLAHNSPEYIQAVCEAMKIATADKDRFIGDPAFVEVPLERILSKAYAAEAAAAIRAGERARVTRLDSAAVVPRDTTHLSVVDNDGNCVALTHSLGMPSGVITPGLGFMYNGCMGVFDPRPGRAGSIAPGKSRFTSSCPSIVFKDDRPEIVLGAPGGTQIAMGVLQTLLNVFEFGMDMQQAVSAPRFSSTSDMIDVCNRIPRRTTDALQAAGYPVARNPFGYTIGWVHAIRLREDGELEGGADPGRDGVAYAL